MAARFVTNYLLPNEEKLRVSCVTTSARDVKVSDEITLSVSKGKNFGICIY
jgi:hypothetical protein